MLRIVLFVVRWLHYDFTKRDLYQTVFLKNKDQDKEEREPSRIKKPLMNGNISVIIYKWTLGHWDHLMKGSYMKHIL